MKTVRHETVHYTAEEMTAKVAADEAHAARKRKRQIIAISIVVSSIVLFCLGCMLLGAITSNEPAAPALSSTAVHEETVGPTPIPIPEHITIATIENERNALTDLQKELYDQALLGKTLQFQGQVQEVYEDGEVLIDEGGFFTVVRLLGIPYDTAATLQKGRLIKGVGTVVDVNTIIGLTVEVQVVSWEIQ